jgi:ketopantoate reductase
LITVIALFTGCESTVTSNSKINKNNIGIGIEVDEINYINVKTIDEDSGLPIEGVVIWVRSGNNENVRTWSKNIISGETNDKGIFYGPIPLGHSYYIVSANKSNNFSGVIDNTINHGNFWMNIPHSGFEGGDGAKGTILKRTPPENPNGGGPSGAGEL